LIRRTNNPWNTNNARSNSLKPCENCGNKKGKTIKKTSLFPLLKTLLSHLRPGDWAVMFLFVALAVGSFWLGGLWQKSGYSAGDAVAIVTAGEQQVATLSLATASDFVIRGALGEMILRVANRRIRIWRSSCPHQVCVRQGEVYRPGQMLVCVPNRVVVLIRRQSQATTSDKKTLDFDAVTY
jgi:hypothetical protein